MTDKNDLTGAAIFARLVIRDYGGPEWNSLIKSRNCAADGADGKLKLKSRLVPAMF